ncbi:MAG: ArsR/SmtB family transcription factor [Candidatus Hodarchaeales archaeon]|jgi:DNA-binding transcriptional regulator GbsR (MarR family)
MKSNIQKENEKINIPKEDPLAIIQALNNETRYSIVIYTLIYHELTLDKLSELLGRSKSTVHHHIQILIETGIISEKTRPGSKKKYYQVLSEKLTGSLVETYDYDTLATLSDEERANYAKILLNQLKPLTTLIKNTLNLVVEYTENLSSTIEKLTLEELQTGMQEHGDMNFNIQLIAEDVFPLYFKKFMEFHKSISQLISSKTSNKSNKTKEAHFIGYTMVIPIKKILDSKYHS